VLTLGDFHIPSRKQDIPESFKEYLVPGKVHHVLCTGNIGDEEQVKKLQKISPNFLMVKGDQDEIEGLPEFKKIKIKHVNFLVFHGHQVLPWGDMSFIALLQKQFQVDFIITGHTHEASFKKVDNFYVLNPGSITGAYTIDDMYFN
jgi:vacuolar protein sorting-associated protein 29